MLELHISYVNGVLLQSSDKISRLLLSPLLLPLSLSLFLSLSRIVFHFHRHFLLPLNTHRPFFIEARISTVIFHQVLCQSHPVHQQVVFQEADERAQDERYK